jgi:hypothetical protein
MTLHHSGKRTVFFARFAVEVGLGFAVAPSVGSFRLGMATFELEDK